MRRNMTLIKRILAYVEKNASYDTELDPPDFPECDASMIFYHTELCLQAGFFTAITSGASTILIQRLTWAGQEELARLRANRD